MKINTSLKQLPLVIAIGLANSSYADFNGADTEYTTDSQRKHIWNEALEPIEMVNSILCFTEQMKANSFVNAGPYLALADEGACFKEHNGGDGNQSAAASNATTYMQVIVDSVQATDSSPLVVSVWIPEMTTGGGEEGPETEAIKFKAVIGEGASDDNPFGSFTFNFDFYDDIADANKVGGGEIKTVDNLDGKIGFTLFEGENDGSEFQKASVVMNADKTEGVALTANKWDDQGHGQAFGMAFNGSHVLVQGTQQENSSDLGDLPYANGDGTAGTCLSRTEFVDAVWRYDLYDSTSGDRVELDSGLSFRYSSTGGDDLDSHGHVGYWGLWTEQEGVLDDGDDITSYDHSSDVSTTYTLIKAPGRLIKHTVKILSLADTVGIDFGSGEDDPFNSGYDQWVVNYLPEGANGAGFYRVAGQNWGQQGPEQTPITPVLLTINGAIHMHSEQLGGGVKYKAGDTEVTFFEQEFVNSVATDLDLRCFDRCLKGELTSADLQDYDGTNSPFDDTVANVGSAIDYSFSATGSNALTLMRGSDEVKIAAGVTQQSLGNSPHGWGVRSGPMVTADVAATMTSIWDIYDLDAGDVYYEWETGLSDWNQMTAITLKDGDGTIVSFDKPIQFSYQHSDDNDRTGDAGDSGGATFMLNYGGNGDLWGIPHEGNGGDRWYPRFNLADGVVMGAGDQYVVKAREIEQKMAASNSCGSLAVTTPAAAVPEATTGSADIGTMPAVGQLLNEGVPAVIGGVIQTAE